MRPAHLGIGKTIVAITALKTGKACFLTEFHPAKEALESFIYPFQYILQNLAMRVFKVGSYFLDFGKLVGLVVIVEGRTDHPISVPAFLQSGVVEFPAKRKRTFKFSDLGFGRKYSKFVSFASFHFCKRSNSSLTRRSRMFCIVSPVRAWSIRKFLSVSTNTFMVWVLFFM
jgi:hypothetical protein